MINLLFVFMLIFTAVTSSRAMGKTPPYDVVHDDIYTIWRSTNISECSRYKAANMLLEYRIDPLLVYPVGVTRSTEPFNPNSLNGCIEGTTFDKSYPQTSFTIQAESGTLVGFNVLLSTETYGGQYISASTSESGTATFEVNIASGGTYFIWSGVLSPDPGHDSFYVSVDGVEDIFDTSDGTWSPSWQWSTVKGRLPAPHTRTFDLAIGTHTIVFRGREKGTGLDIIQITK